MVRQKENQMVNRLPEKLSLLRKHFGYSQGDIANRLGVNVTDYIHWENGSILPEISRLKDIANLFHVSLDSLFDNTAPLVLPDLSKLQDSVEIAFMNKAGMETEVIDVADNMLPVDGVIQGENTQVLSNVSQSERTAQLNSAEVVSSTTNTPKKKNTKTDAQKKKTTIFIIAGVAILTLLLSLLILLLNSGKNTTASLSRENRLAEGDTYTMFIQENGDVKVWGEFGNIEEFKDILQVSAYESHAAALTKEGTVLTTDGDTIVKSWKDIQKVAAGNTHTVALNQNNEVLCSGSSTACKVEDWENIKSIYAGKDVTVGVTSEGILKVAGDYAQSLDGTEGVKNVGLSSTMIALVKIDGSVKAYRLSDNSEVDVSTLNSIEDIAVGKDFIAGLNRTGDVSIVTEDKDLQKAVKGWTNSSFIAADDDTLIAIDSSNGIHGYGENTHKQYGEVAETPTPEEKEAEQLGLVENIIFDQSTTNVQIRWDAVKNANSYEITFNPSINTTIPRSAGTSVSVPTSAFVKDQEYIVSIVAHAQDEEKYKPSEASIAKFTYVPKTVQLSSPTGVQALTAPNTWNIIWEPVENADYYLVSVDGGKEVKTKETVLEYDTTGKNFTGGSYHTISITAASDDEKYTNSSPTETTMTYDLPVYHVDIKFVDQSTGDAIGSGTLSLAEGRYTHGQIYDQIKAQTPLPEAYELVDPNREVNINSNYVVEISVKFTDATDGG